MARGKRRRRRRRRRYYSVGRTGRRGRSHAAGAGSLAAPLLLLAALPLLAGPGSAMFRYVISVVTGSDPTETVLTEDGWYEIRFKRRAPHLAEGGESCRLRLNPFVWLTGGLRACRGE